MKMFLLLVIATLLSSYVISNQNTASAAYWICGKTCTPSNTCYTSKIAFDSSWDMDQLCLDYVGFSGQFDCTTDSDCY